MKKPAFYRLGLGIAGAIAACAVAPAAVHPFADLVANAAQESGSVTSNGSATMDCVFNDSTRKITWYVEYTLDTGSSQLIASHFHGPAAAGTDAGVKISLDPGSFPLGNSNHYSGSATANSGDVADVLAGLWYLNLHSNIYTGGELRGQMITTPSTHFCDANVINQAQEETPTGSAGTGTIDVSYNNATNKLTFGLSWSGLTSTVLAMHFHKGAAGTSGGVEIGLDSAGVFPTGTSGSFAGTVTLTPTQETDFLAGNWYVNIHTTNHSGGEIRGQLNPQSLSSVGDWSLYESREALGTGDSGKDALIIDYRNVLDKCTCRVGTSCGKK